MNSQEKRTFVGIWIDHSKALLITTEDHSGHGDYDVRKKIESHVTSARGSSEHTQHHRQKNETEKYFKAVSKELEAFSDVLIFGPGNAQEELFNYLRENKHFHGRNLSIDTAGNLTDNQVIAKVRDFFSPMVQAG